MIVSEIMGTAWKVSKYGAEKTPYLDTFHVVGYFWYCVDFHVVGLLFNLYYQS